MTLFENNRFHHSRKKNDFRFIVNYVTDFQYITQNIDYDVNLIISTHNIMMTVVDDFKHILY